MNESLLSITDPIHFLAEESLVRVDSSDDTLSLHESDFDSIPLMRPLIPIEDIESPPEQDSRKSVYRAPRAPRPTAKEEGKWGVGQTTMEKLRSADDEYYSEYEESASLLEDNFGKTPQGIIQQVQEDVSSSTYHTNF